MAFQHIFKAKVNWQLVTHETTQNPKGFSRNHVVTIPNKKAPLEVSAAKPFRGDETLYNPEDLLLSALASCHMMSYLYVCAQHHIAVLNYEDHAEAILDVDGSGSGRFKKVTLHPVVMIQDATKKELAKSLHAKANALCFIANSCNFPVEHQAEIYIKNAPH
ncbi:OsmC family protein [Algibacter mikhailovii]|uniref:OsmC family protein n=1 Tax=Algibacter mikhailovii TaxID=425498 RepID=UPI002495108E|nr:OsmC family protein [Algibacter mikhailovii]